MFKSGDVVTLKNSNVKMNVHAVYGELVECIWTDQFNNINTKQVHKDVLKLFNESQSNNEGLLLG